MTNTILSVKDPAPDTGAGQGEWAVVKDQEGPPKALGFRFSQCYKGALTVNPMHAALIDPTPLGNHPKPKSGAEKSMER